MSGKLPKLTELDAWAEDHNRRRLDELCDESVLSKEKMLLYLAHRQIVSKHTVMNQYGISLDEEVRRLHAERVG